MENDTQEYEVQDNSGMAEISHAIQEIEKLKDEGHQDEHKYQEDSHEEETDQIEQDQEDSHEEEHENKEAANDPTESDRDKFWRQKRDKYARIAQKQQLAEENAQLKQMLDEALNSGTYHYGRSAYADLEKAKEDKRKAIETGNVDGLIEADIALTRAMNTVSEVEKLQSNGQLKPKTNNQRETDYIAPSDELYQEMAKDWLEEHNYLQSGSKSYNPELARKVNGFINNLDQNLAQRNRQDLYFTSEYFDTIDNYITTLKKTDKPARNVTSSYAGVGGVRTNSYSSAGKKSSVNNIKLNDDERIMAANAGVSEAEWLKYKINQIKGNKQ